MEYEKLKVLTQKAADLTNPECHRCRVPFACCNQSACELTERIAQDLRMDLGQFKTDHPTMPFMGPNGCVLEPYQRVVCALHTCEIASHGCFVGDMNKTREYWELREAILAEIERLIHGGQAI